MNDRSFLQAVVSGAGGTTVSTETQQNDLGEELVRVALGVAQHRPELVWAYFGPESWLDEARLTPDDAQTLLRRANELCARAETYNDAFVYGEANALAAHLGSMLGERQSFQDFVRRVLDIDKVRPSADELAHLRSQVLELAANVVGGHDPVNRWETTFAIVGEAKWNIAIEAYVEGRRWLATKYPLPIVEDLEIGRDTEHHSSVHMNWKSGQTMRLGINPTVPRTPQTTRFEVAHNAYPGDYLRIAALTQYAYQSKAITAACVKLKDAPESVISEGLEDTAYLRLVASPTPEDILATKLEWLRRGVAASAAVMARDENVPRSIVAEFLMKDGFMGSDRVENELRLVDHPVWGPYRATYWAGRELITSADRIATASNLGSDYLRFLFGELHTPRSLLAALETQVTAAAPA